MCNIKLYADDVKVYKKIQNHCDRIILTGPYVGISLFPLINAVFYKLVITTLPSHIFLDLINLI
jgi:hypothetical protein